MKNILRKTELGLLKFKDTTAVTSKTVADALGVSHRDLLLNVKKAEKYLKSHCSELSTQNSNYYPIFQVCGDTPQNSNYYPIFQDYTYESRGKTYKCKLMNEDAVKVLIKVVDTQAAFDYFVMLMSEFNDMKMERKVRKAIVAPTKRLNQQLQRLQKRLDDELPLKENGKKSGKIKMIYIHIQTAINKVVAGKAKGYDRDALSLERVAEIDYLEMLIANRVEKHLDLNIEAIKIREDALGLLKKLR